MKWLLSAATVVTIQWLWSNTLKHTYADITKHFKGTLEQISNEINNF